MQFTTQRDRIRVQAKTQQTAQKYRVRSILIVIAGETLKTMADCSVAVRKI